MTNQLQHRPERVDALSATNGGGGTCGPYRSGVLGIRILGVGRRVHQLQQQLTDLRGRRVVLLSHCLLNQNVRYLGRAGRAGGDNEVVADYLRRGIGIHQMPCPEQRAWGGVLKRMMLVAYGSGGTLRAPLVRLLLGPFVRYTRFRYARLARTVVRDVLDYRRAEVDVVGVVGVADSPSCGVYTTLDLSGAVEVPTRCPLARLDLRTLNEDVVAAHVRPGQGLYTRAFQHRLADVGATVRFDEHNPAPGPYGPARRPASLA